MRHGNSAACSSFEAPDPAVNHYKLHYRFDHCRVGGMKRKLKTVRPQNSANSCLKEVSRDLTEIRDLFLYNTVMRTAIPKYDDNDSGGSF